MILKFSPKSPKGQKGYDGSLDEPSWGTNATQWHSATQPGPENLSMDVEEKFPSMETVSAQVTRNAWFHLPTRRCLARNGLLLFSLSSSMVCEYPGEHYLGRWMKIQTMAVKDGKIRYFDPLAVQHCHTITNQCRQCITDTQQKQSREKQHLYWQQQSLTHAPSHQIVQGQLIQS